MKEKKFLFFTFLKVCYLWFSVASGKSLLKVQMVIIIFSQRKYLLH